MTNATHAVQALDERTLLLRLESLLELEDGHLASQDADGLVALAGERETLVVQLGDAARARRVSPGLTDTEQAELAALYERLRQRHDIRAQVMRRRVERTRRAIGVLAQANNQQGLYEADGRVTMQFAAR